MCNMGMDLIATGVTKQHQDPVVVVIDIGWMRRLIENGQPGHLVTIIDLLYSYGLYNENTITYLETDNGHNADDDVILEWESNLQKIIGDRKSWEWIINNVPDNVFNGFDMGIGGDNHGGGMLDMLNALPKNIDRVVLSTETGSMHSAAQAIDEEKTLKISSYEPTDSNILHISHYTNEVVKRWTNDENQSGHLPKALYRLMKLSELNEYPNSINYYILKI